MSTIMNNVLMSHLNEEGDRVIDLPITKPENVDGLDEHIEEVSASTFKGIDCGTLESIGILEKGENEDG